VRDELMLDGGANNLGADQACTTSDDNLHA
jgi:hypothetical protein